MFFTAILTCKLFIDLTKHVQPDTIVKSMSKKKFVLDFLYLFKQDILELDIKTLYCIVRKRT